LLSQPAVAIADTARNPRTNVGNLSQTNRARARRPGATRSASPRDAQYNAKPSTTNPISALRVDFTSTAIFLSCSEYSTQREDRRDGIADVGIAGPDGAFGGDDGRHTADGRSDSQQRSELAGQAEKCAAARMIPPASAMSTKICTSEIPPSLTTSPSTKRTPRATIPIFNQNS